MIQHSPGSRLRARTIELDESPELTSLLPADGTAWIRNGSGMVGIGEVARFTGSDFVAAQQWWQNFLAELEIDSELGEHPGSGPIAFGSFTFDPDHSAQTSVLIVPKMVIGSRGRRHWLTTIGAPDEPTPVLPAPQGAPQRPHAATIRGGSVDRDRWLAIVADAVARISAEELEKVVLARSEEIAVAEPLDPRWLVTELTRRYPSCWTFLVDTMVGASPEMLLRREGGLVTSRVLAGTIRREGDEELDLKLAHALARSSKNLIEHELAVASVAQALEPFCSGMNVPDAPWVLELPNVMHLASDVTAVVHPDVTALQLAGELHPSAAVCGTPRATARGLIAELENLDRGRYSGPVGWLDSRGDGEFAIALRSGWLHPDDPTRITVYAGCGIVAESDPVEEYAETQAKLTPMHDVLALTTED